ncbi:hypothetical protein C8R46DRAFT_46987 [Mycena filopes]|nr:hypothetical protein C8R46DRAFT_46987 [Mycena filopes]
MAIPSRPGAFSTLRSRSNVRWGTRKRGIHTRLINVEMNIVERWFKSPVQSKIRNIRLMAQALTGVPPLRFVRVVVLSPTTPMYKLNLCERMLGNYICGLSEFAPSTRDGRRHPFRPPRQSVAVDEAAEGASTKLGIGNRWGFRVLPPFRSLGRVQTTSGNCPREEDRPSVTVRGRAPFGISQAPPCRSLGRVNEVDICRVGHPFRARTRLTVGYFACGDD